MFGLSGREFQWLEQNLELEHGGRIYGVQEDKQGVEIGSGSYHRVLVVLRRRDFEGRGTGGKTPAILRLQQPWRRRLQLLLLHHFRVLF